MTIKTLYIYLSLFTAVLLFLIGNYTISKTFSSQNKSKNKRILLGFGLIGWLVYIYLIGESGFLLNFDFPPRFFLFMVLPAFIFTGVFLYKNRKNDWIKNIPKSWLIYFQTFRIGVELLFVYSLTEGLLNKEVTWEGYNYDLLMGITAPILGFLVFNRNIISQKVALWWNYLGILILASVIFLFISSLYLPQLFGSETVLLPKEVGSFPLVLIAGFLMPSAVFIHFLSIIQLSGNLSNQN